MKQYMAREWEVFTKDLRQLRKPQTWPNILLHVSTVFLGCLLIAATVNFFVVPARFGDGGFTGIAILINYMNGIDIEYVVPWLNIPLVLFGIPFLGYRLIFHTVLGVTLISLAFHLTSPLKSFTSWHVHDPWITVLFGGAMMGLGLGTVLRVGGNTGGTDLVALMVKRFAGVPLNWTLFACDASVLSFALYYLGLKKFLHTLAYMLVYTLVIKVILENLDSSRAVTIISSQARVIIQEIKNGKLNHGATVLKGQGSYTHQQRDIIYTVVPTHELKTLRTLVGDTDPTALVIVGSVRKVLGIKFPPLKNHSPQETPPETTSTPDPSVRSTLS
ncbi:YitT family protein [Pasteuria penetrans]|uniref:YitT family protein n=1 Tax=Pasteuria penetrans TaxID=86005 RepID=UPI000FBB88B7|nr:YitT family protein [Pasteuria penetrans]